jgi:hypothetical protein
MYESGRTPVDAVPKSVSGKSLGREVAISDKWSGKLPRNRLRGHVPQQDLANNVMDQKKTSGEFGLPTSTERAFYVKLTPNRPTSGWLVI